MTQPKIPRLLGFGRGRAKRPQLDVVDGGKAVKENDKLEESLAQTQASGDTQTGGAVDRGISLARTMAATGDAARGTSEGIKETGPASFAETVAPVGDLAPAPSPALDESTPALMRTMAATADELKDSAKRSAGASSGLENSLARTMIATDAGASGSLEAAAPDAEPLGFARTITPQDAARSQDSRDSRPSLRRDEAITDDPDLGQRVLAPDGDDRRLKDMIRARLFRKKAAPVKIGRYTILDRLGEGGMGVVYTAYDDKLERKVAIKVMRSEGEGDSNGRNRLVREAQAMARLSHPNIVTVHEVGEVDGQVFVAMEFVRGQSLDFWLREARPWREVVDVYVLAGRGLAAAHAAGIIHRDFKPHNVLLGDDGAAKVLDFGLARSMGQLTGEVPEAEKAMVPAGERGLSLLDQRLTRTGAIMGTPAYMAPEQHQGIDATAKSDQFSFCVALYEALYGELPFEASSLATLIAAVVEGTIKEPPSGSKVPSWLRKVVLRGLAVDPEVRYPTIAELLAALGRDPVARRNRWLATASFAAIVGGAGFGLASVGAAEAAVCVDADQEVAAVWNDDARAAVEAAINGTGVAYAGETWERVAPKLDAYAEDWAAMRTEACESHRSGKHSARLYDLQTACLDQHMAEFRGLVAVFGEIKADEVTNVVQAASGLSPVSRCGDTNSLTQDVAPPAQEVAAAVDDARIDLGYVRALALAGRYDDARTELDKLPPVDYAPLEAEKSLLRGSIDLDAGHGDAAKGPLSDALWSALAVGHDRVALDAISKQLFVKSVYLSDAEDALSDYPLAEALLQRTGDSPRARGELENNIGAVYEDLGRIDDAKAAYQRAIDERLAALGEQHHEVAYSLANLGLLLCHEKHYDEAIEPLTRSLSTMSAALGEHHPHTASALLNTAVAYRGAGRLDKALDATRQALSILAESSDTGSSLYQYSLNMRARLHVDRRDFERAVEDYEALLRTEHGGGSTDIRSEIHAVLALAYAGAGDLEKSEASTQAALSLVQRDGASPRFLVQALDWSGVTSLFAGDPATAVTHLEKSLAVQKESLNADAPPLAFTLEKLAQAQLALERYDDAAASLQGARAIVDAELPAKSQLTAQVRRTEAELALARGDADAAVEHARAALGIHESTRDAEDGELALSRFALARALRAADAGSGEAAELADKALQGLRAGGDGWASEADAIDTWLNG